MKITSITMFKRISLIISGLTFFLLISACKKTPDPEPAVEVETGTLTDMEGHVYKTIKIGNQWWMAENLRVTKYRDGTTINPIKSLEKDEWKKDTAGAYTTEVFLYNWYAVNNVKNITPEGWHIPSDEEWKELEKELGMAADEADKTGWRGANEGEELMKEYDETTATCWIRYGDVWPTNTSGFTALPEGCRFLDGSKGDGTARQTGFWWSSSAYGNEAWYRHLDYKNKDVFRYHGPKTYGFSIRCIKN